MGAERDRKWLALACAGAELFSTCSRRQYMAIVVDIDGRVVGSGYNGSPPGHAHCVDGACPHANDPHGLSSVNTGNCIAVHAEANALLYSDRIARRGGTLYVNGIPCDQCARLIAGSGLARVVCMNVGTPGEGIDILQESGIEVEVAS